MNFHLIPKSKNVIGDIPKVSHDMVREINRLHAVSRKNVEASREALNAALCAAWHAGKLLCEAKVSVIHHAGLGTWVPWLKNCFHGHIRTAQRYMKLSRCVESPSHLSGMSLRQAYFRLGIATEPKKPRTAVPVVKLSAHILYANKLTRILRLMRRRIRTQDMAPLYAQLRMMFEQEEGKAG